MRLPLLSDFIERRGRERLRRIMRGYRLLHRTGQLSRIPRLQEALTTTCYERCVVGSSGLIFGAGRPSAELIVRQYLLTRFAGVSLNKSLLTALGSGNARVVHPLPAHWRRVVRQHGFEVADFRCAVAWAAYLVCYFIYGAASFLCRLAFGIRTMFSRSECDRGAYAYFDSLIRSNLPQPDKGGISHDIISWYDQSGVRLTTLVRLCHNVRAAETTTTRGTRVISVRSPVPSLDAPTAILSFIGWGIAAVSLAAFDLLRGRWWHALLLAEGARAAEVRCHSSSRLAREYLFHNSSWIYRPLWSYEAERRGSRISFYFYSTNCEPFKKRDGYSSGPYGWMAASWSRYLVWDERQAEFVMRLGGRRPEVLVVGPIWFSTSPAEMPVLPPKTVAVFDVQPVRDTFYRSLGIDYDYYVPATATAFLEDIAAVSQRFAVAMALKRKRQIGRLAHPWYRNCIARLEQQPTFVPVEAEISTVSLIEKCGAAISMPYTSTALTARSLGKPSCYYDATGLLLVGDPASHGIPIIQGREALAKWMAEHCATMANDRSARCAIGTPESAQR